MKKRISQNGFGHTLVLLLLVVVAVVALVGYKVMKNQTSTRLSSETSSTPLSTASTIKTSADLQKAETTISNQNVDSDLNPDQMNDDIDSLL